METKKIIFVTGITGNQGGAVADHLLRNGHKVIGLTRNINSEKALEWKNKGATLVEGDLEDLSSYNTEVKKCEVAFLVQALQPKQKEIEQAKKFIQNLVDIGINRLVYSSVLGADLNTGVPHFESKYEIEKFIKSLNIDYTILRPASFYENHLMPRVAEGIKRGKYTTPLKKTCKQQMIGVSDIGKIATKVIEQPEKYSHKIISIATDQYEIKDVPPIFAEVLGKPVKYQKLPGFLTRLALGKDLYKMFNYMNKHNFCVVENIEEIRKDFNIKGDFKQWIKQNFAG